MSTRPTNPRVIIDELVHRLETGEIEGLSASRSLLEGLNFLEINQEATSYELAALYICRGFIFDVLSNLTGSASFSFPDKESIPGQSIATIVKKTGRFLENASIPNVSVAYSELQDAISIYYKLLAQINNTSKNSDLSFLD